uniref:DUF1985 domain-containing protein n=1 Tax=Noccaea caerulescens TaxID=107243 RepID=A0A1J3JGG5_NOCCA
MASDFPKRLYKEGAEPKVDKINQCAKMSILTTLKDHMEDELNEVKKDPVFAHILAIHDNRLTFSGKLVHSLMCRQLLTAKKHELWFVFARRPLRFSLQEFHAVTGLKCQDDGNYELGKWADDGGFWSKLIKRKGNISMKAIREEHVLEAHKRVVWTG